MFARAYGAAWVKGTKVFGLGETIDGIMGVVPLSAARYFW